MSLKGVSIERIRAGTKETFLCDIEMPDNREVEETLGAGFGGSVEGARAGIWICHGVPPSPLFPAKYSKD